METKYNELLVQNQAAQAVTLVYNKVAAEFNKDMATTAKNRVFRSFANSIKYFATLDEENVVLLQVGNDAAKLYTFDQIYEGIENMTLQARVSMGKTGLPTLLIVDVNSNQPLLQYRVKQEFKPDGSPYIRNYVEKQTALGTLIGESL